MGPKLDQKGGTYEKTRDDAENKQAHEEVKYYSVPK